MKLLVLLLANLTLFHYSAGQGLLFNEAMIINSSFPSEDGKFYPWIEFANNSTRTIDLSEFYISTDSSNLKQWGLPTVSLAPDSLFLLWISGNGTSNHSDFRIEAAGDENLLLTDGSLILDYIPIKSMLKNESYGWREGFNGERVYFIELEDITPGKANIDPGPWVKVQGNAAFPRGDCGYFGSVVYDEKMWFLDYETLTDDGSSWINLVEIWNSSDGFSWNLVNANPPYKHGSMVAVFDGYMWAFDGRGFRSTDGIQWEQVSLNTPQSERIAVFNNCLWILQNESIYRSFDGIVWEKVVEEVPWYGRRWPAFMEHNGRLWMFGGNTNYNSSFDLYYSDVWSSGDGINWRLENYRAPWRGAFWFGYASYDGKIWMIDGGWNFWDRLNLFNGNGNEVWYSEDGVDWQKSTAPTNWFNRHAQFIWVFNDELWVGAGYAGGGLHHLYNDIWKYSRKPRSIDASPEVLATYGINLPLTNIADSTFPIDYSIQDPAIATTKNDTLTTTNVGETSIILSSKGDDFYRSATTTSKLSVAKKDLIIKPANAGITFGQALPEVSLEYSGFVRGDDLNVLDELPIIKVLPDAFPRIGMHYLTAEGGSDKNYNYVFEKGQLIVTPSNTEALFFPNPVKTNLQIVSSTMVEGEMVIELYSSTGILIHQYVEHNFVKGKINISSLPAGIYIVKITSSLRTIVGRVIKT